MKTTVQALKELYAKLGGNLADVALIERIPEMIEALNSIAVAVPSVTAADAGKVLTVSDAGAWEAAAASGGGAVWIDLDIPQVIYPTSPLNFVTNHELLDQIIQQIDEAYEAGKMIYIRAWNHFVNYEINMYSVHPNAEVIYSLVGRTDDVEGSLWDQNKTFIFAAAHVVNETDPGVILFDATASEIYAANSGMYYYSD